MTHCRSWNLAVPALALAALVPLVTASALAQDSRRDQWQRVDDIARELGAVAGARIADVGAGDGYFTTRLATAVGSTGRVYAVDVNPVALERLRGRLERDAIANVEVVESAIDDPRLPAGAIDGALIVNAYHEMTRHREMLAGIARALRPGGRLVIVEPISDRYRESTRAEQTERHEIAAHFVLEDLRDAGYRIVRFEEEFAKRPGGDSEWIIVASPRAGTGTPPAPPGDGGRASAETPAVPRLDWRSDEIRISLADARALHERDGALFIDVRNLELFDEGHLPGARLMMLDEMESQAAALSASGRRVIAYCS